MIEIPSNQRFYIRHPASFPVQVNEGEELFCDGHQMQDISYGGLSFQASRCYDPGQMISIEIPSPQMSYRTPCVVKWCRTRVDGVFIVGVEFLDPKHEHQVRMVEQICHIEAYRQIIEESEDRSLTELEAAQEWIAKFASTFQQPEDYTERLVKDGVLPDN
jgi:hypothetical protein